jgi:molybdenum cofactor cytidylyltransferase
MSVDVCGIVLASGQSTRMGRQKLLLNWKNKAIIEHVLQSVMDSPLKDVKVIIPQQQLSLLAKVAGFPFQIIFNRCPQLGLGHSVSTAISALPETTEAAIFILGDQPSVSSSDIELLLDTFRIRRGCLDSCPKTILQMKYRDGRIGHPVLFTKHYFSKLKKVSGDKGGRDIIKGSLDNILLCESPNRYPNDLDTWDDYQDLLRNGKE